MHLWPVKTDSDPGAPLSRRELIQIEKVRLLFSQSLPASMISIVIAALFVASAIELTGATWLVTWLIVSIVGSLIRVALFLAYLKVRPEGRALLRWEHPYFHTLLLSSAIWGVGMALVAIEDHPSSQFVAIAFALGMAAGALSAYSAMPYMVLHSTSVILMPVLSVLLLDSASANRLMGLSGLLLYLSTQRSSQLLSRSLTANLELRFDLEDAKAHAERTARTDMLTGLWNRRAFMEAASALLAQSKPADLGTRPAHIVMLDIDHFKQVNDVHGHAAGDVALQQIALILKRKTRAQDMCCRLGGEEFCILMTDTRPHEAMALAERIRKSIEGTPCLLAGARMLCITASLGVATIRRSEPGAPEDRFRPSALDEALNRADSAMYRAKREGRNRVCPFVDDTDVCVIEPPSSGFSARMAGAMSRRTDIGTSPPMADPAPATVLPDTSGTSGTAAQTDAIAPAHAVGPDVAECNAGTGAAARAPRPAPRPTALLPP